MSDGLTDYRSMLTAADSHDDVWRSCPCNVCQQRRATAWAESGREAVRGWHRWNDPIVPRRVTEYGRMMWAADLGLPSNNAAPYFWLGRDAEAAHG